MEMRAHYRLLCVACALGCGAVQNEHRPSASMSADPSDSTLTAAYLAVIDEVRRFEVERQMSGVPGAGYVLIDRMYREFLSPADAPLPEGLAERAHSLGLINDSCGWNRDCRKVTSSAKALIELQVFTELDDGTLKGGAVTREFAPKAPPGPDFSRVYYSAHVTWTTKGWIVRSLEVIAGS